MSGYVSPHGGARGGDSQPKSIRRAEESKWVLDKDQLTDQAIIRRMVLKRCIYGVDKNPADRRVGQSVAVAAQLHRRRAALLPGPPPALPATRWSACGWPKMTTDELNRLGGFFASQLRHCRGGGRHRRACSQHRGDIRRRRQPRCMNRRRCFTGWRRRLRTSVACSTSSAGWRWLTAGMKKKERDGLLRRPCWSRRSRTGSPAKAYHLLARGPAHLGDEAPDSDATTMGAVCRALARGERDHRRPRRLPALGGGFSWSLDTDWQTPTPARRL